MSMDGSPLSRVPPLTKWWPIGFFIAAIVFFIIGGGLAGSAASSDSNCYANYSAYNSSYSDYISCLEDSANEARAGIAFFVLGALLKLAAWVLLLLYCVQRRRTRAQAQSAAMYDISPPTVETAHQPYKQRSAV